MIAWGINKSGTSGPEPCPNHTVFRFSLYLRRVVGLARTPGNSTHAAAIDPRPTSIVVAEKSDPDVRSVAADLQNVFDGHLRRRLDGRQVAARGETGAHALRGVKGAGEVGDEEAAVPHTVPAAGALPGGREQLLQHRDVVGDGVEAVSESGNLRGDYSQFIDDFTGFVSTGNRQPGDAQQHHQARDTFEWRHRDTATLQ